MQSRNQLLLLDPGATTLNGFPTVIFLGRSVLLIDKHKDKDGWLPSMLIPV